MSTSAFSIGNVHQEFGIQTGQISGEGNAESPYLVIPISFSFFPYRRGNAFPYNEFTIIHISGELFLTTDKIKIGEVSIPVNIYVYQPMNWLYSLRFPMTNQRLYHIEKRRDGNLTGFILLNFQVAYHDTLPPITDKGGFRQQITRNFEMTQGYTAFTIEQSLWVSQVLPRLGYNAPSLIELPAISLLLPAEYAVALAELTEAKRYFIAGDYDKAVGHCRSAIEPIKKEFATVKAYIPSGSRFEWLKTNLKATYEYIQAILVANYSIANKSHHPPTNGNFNRIDAETILNSTYLILAYLGKLLPEEPS